MFFVLYTLYGKVGNAPPRQDWAAFQIPSVPSRSVGREPVQSTNTVDHALHSASTLSPFLSLANDAWNACQINNAHTSSQPSSSKMRFCIVATSSSRMVVRRFAMSSTSARVFGNKPHVGNKAAHGALRKRTNRLNHYSPTTSQASLRAAMSL